MGTASSPTPQGNGTGLTASRPEVQEIIRTLKKESLELDDYRAVGEQMSKLKGPPGSGWRKQIAKLVPKSEATLNKCLQCFEKCSRGELLRLKQMGVGWGRLTIALALADADEDARYRFLLRAKEANLTDRQVHQEVQRENRSHRGGGRKRKGRGGRGCLTDVAQFISLAGRLLDFHCGAWSAGQRTYASEAAGLPANGKRQLRRLLRKARDNAKGLQGLPKGVMATLRAIWIATGPKGKGRPGSPGKAPGGGACLAPGADALSGGPAPGEARDEAAAGSGFAGLS